MGRSILQIGDNAVEILFPDYANMASLARATGISQATLHRRKTNPQDIRIAELRRIAKAQNLTDEEIVKVIRGRKK